MSEGAATTPICGLYPLYFNSFWPLKNALSKCSFQSGAKVELRMIRVYQPNMKSIEKGIQRLVPLGGGGAHVLLVGAVV
jgi:hypothetical protein